MARAYTYRSETRAVRGRAGFTLAELVVAVGTALLLTFGVGQVFQSVGDIVSQGTAIAEVDQYARSIERQIRDDFRALNNMDAGDTFVAIRNRIVTDVYLSRDDEEADLREGTAGTEFSRILRETRLDEIMFIAQSNEQGFISYESSPGSNNIVRSGFARIYYGHGLRPVPEPRDLAPNTPFARIPDGDFGSPRDPSDPLNIYGIGSVTYETRADDGTIGTGSVETNNVSPAARNKYAGDWPLARQVLLLAEEGGLIMGNTLGSGAGGSNSIIGAQREYAPYVRDLESEFRFDIRDGRPDPGPGSTALSAPTQINPNLVSNPRLIRHGRTDICAQSRDEMIQWLEGRVPSFPNLGIKASAATAWNGGAWNVVSQFDPVPTSNLTMPSQRDAALWGRVVPLVLSPSPAMINQALATNFRGVQSAIAGMFVRPLVETEPPDIDRVVNTINTSTSSTSPEDALMDLHATLAPRCSRFEIAWSDDRLWDDVSTPITNGNQTANFFREEREDIQPRDRLWYDYNFTRRDLWEVVEQRYDLTRLGVFHQDPEIIPPEAPFSMVPNPPIFRTNWTGIAGVSGERETRLNLRAVASNSDTNAYDPLRTGGSVGVDVFSNSDDDEYLAIFPFRLFSETDGFSIENDDNDNVEIEAIPYPKPRLIRIRMTLHDSNLVLREGKSYQFEIRVNPR